MRVGIGLIIAIFMATQAAASPNIIRFGLTGDYPPFAQRHADGSLTGADVDMARLFAVRSGARAQFVHTTWTSLAADLEAGRFDVAIGGLSVTPERTKSGIFSIPLLQDGKRPLGRCNRIEGLTSLAQIDSPSVRVQINRGPAIGLLAQRWFRRATVVRVTDDAALIPNLLEGRTDVWITDGVVVDHMARRYKGRLCAARTAPFTPDTKAWLIRKDAALVRRTNAFLVAALPAWRAALDSVP